MFGGDNKDDEIVPCGERMKLLLKYNWRLLVTIITPIIALVIILPGPTKAHEWCAYCLCVMAVYWVTECIALPVTSFLPIVIFPLSNVMDSGTTSVSYFNNTILMFIGSLILATAVEQSGLHRRIALCAVRSIGYSHYKLLFAICFITMFVSMWVTNTAATTMMVPISFALLQVFQEQGLLEIYDTNSNGDQESSDLTACYFCAITYSATIGGIGTLVGTGTNLAFKGLFETAHPDLPELITFPKFSAFTIPVMFLTELLTYIWFIFVYFGFCRPNSKTAKSVKLTPEGLAAAKDAVAKQTKAIGRITFWEVMVVLLFAFAIALFFCRSPQIFVGWADAITKHYGVPTKTIQDSTPALFVCVLMLVLPRSPEILKNCSAKNREQLPHGRIKSVIDWKTMNAVLPYSFSFLLGGGFAISTAAQKKYTDLNGRMGDVLAKLDALPGPLILLIIIIFTTFVTNFASNVATCNVVSPIAMTLAEKIKKSSLLYCLATGISASYCFCLSVGTPGNIIVQSAAKIPIRKMIVAGIGPTIFSVLFTWAGLLLYSDAIWPEMAKGT